MATPTLYLPNDAPANPRRDDSRVPFQRRARRIDEMELRAVGRQPGVRRQIHPGRLMTSSSSRRKAGASIAAAMRSFEVSLAIRNLT